LNHPVDSFYTEDLPMKKTVTFIIALTLLILSLSVIANTSTEKKKVIKKGQPAQSVKYQAKKKPLIKKKPLVKKKVVTTKDTEEDD
jgi:hypothetical protein